MFRKFLELAFWVLKRFCSSKTDRVTNFWLSSAVNSCYSCRDRRKRMLEALYDKTCLPKCSGNWLEMHFEYLNVSVAQKLTELWIFGCQGYSRGQFGKTLGTLWQYTWDTLNVFWCAVLGRSIRQFRETGDTF